MALVPSGRVRIMEAQLHKQAIGPTDMPGASQPVQPRTEIEQSQVVPQGTTSPTPSPAQTPEPEIAQPEMGEQLGQPEPGMTDEPAKTDNQPQPDLTGDDEKGKKASPLKSYVFQIIEKAGAKRAKMDELDQKGKMFDSEIGFDRKRKGWFIIPTFTANGEIDEDKAYAIAQNVANKFQLMFKLKINGRNWKVEFASIQEEKNTADGSSLDDLDGSNEQTQQNKKVAFTLGELLTARKDELYDMMRKIAEKE